MWRAGILPAVPLASSRHLRGRQDAGGTAAWKAARHSFGAIAEVVMRALEHDPSLRPPAAELAERLREAAGS